MSVPAPSPAAVPGGDTRAAGGGGDVGSVLAGLVAAPPSCTVLDAAIGLSGRADLSDSDRVDLAVVFERCDAWLQASKQPVLAALGRAAGRKTTTPGRWEDIGLEMALALRWSEWMAHDRMDRARLLDERLPGTLAALGAGTITASQARLLVDGAGLLDHPRAADPVAAAAELEARVLPEAGEQTKAQTEKAVARALIAIDPDAVEQERTQTRQRRGVFRTAGPQSLMDRLQGGAGLVAHGAAEDVATIWQGLSVGGDQLLTAGQVDSLSQGRFDTLLAWATDYLRDQPVPGRGARPTAVTLIARQTTLAGQDNDPAELLGYGPITAQAARDLAGGVPPRPGPFGDMGCAVDDDTSYTYGRTLHDEIDDEAEADQTIPIAYNDVRRDIDDDDEPPDPDDGGPGGGGGGGPPPAPPGPAPGSPTVSMRVLHIDPHTGYALPRDGLRLDYGTRRRLFPPEVVDYLRDLYRRCSFPGCTAPVHKLDGDHWKQFARGGRTDATTSGGPGCVHHNRTTRNRPGWTITPHGDGTATLTTPHRRNYPIKPFDYRTL